jgi:Uma2 family endonuclease
MTERHTIQEWLENPDERLELIEGELVPKPLSGMPEGNAKGGISAVLRSSFHSASGGWWFGASVDTQLGEDGFRPDLAGWRRARFTTAIDGRPGVLRPDWICEVMGPLHRGGDLLQRLRLFHQAGVPHFWVLDVRSGVLAVFRHEALGYLNVLTAERGQLVRAEPFDAIEINVGILLGDDPE